MVGLTYYAKKIIDFLGEEGRPLHEFSAFLASIKVPSNVLEELHRLRVFEWLEVEGQVIYVLGEGAKLFESAPGADQDEEEAPPQSDSLEERVYEYLLKCPSIGFLRLALDLGLDPKDNNSLQQLRVAVKTLERIGLVSFDEEVGVVNLRPWRKAPIKASCKLELEAEGVSEPGQRRRREVTLLDFA